MWYNQLSWTFSSQLPHTHTHTGHIHTIWSAKRDARKAFAPLRLIVRLWVLHSAIWAFNVSRRRTLRRRYVFARASVSIHLDVSIRMAIVSYFVPFRYFICIVDWFIIYILCAFSKFSRRSLRRGFQSSISTIEHWFEFGASLLSSFPGESRTRTDQFHNTIETSRVGTNLW